MSVKTKEIRKGELRGWTIEGGAEYRTWKVEREPLAQRLVVKKSEVETFEWSLITLVSVAFSILLSQ